PIKPGLEPVLHAIDQFEKHLLQISTYDNFLMDPDVYERVISHHIGCKIGTETVRQELNQEISDMEEIMEREARQLGPYSSWAEAIESQPMPPLPEDGLIGLYRKEVLALEEHCIEKGMVKKDLLRSCPVCVEPVPSSLTAIRSAAAYSMPPGYPPRGGTFYILDSEVSGRQ
ncbi:MAG: hypothetical protein SVY10_21625, partial [Thermodesulfobacteriota bacterium]|nr:hypothetical protein [Thermodesulfobacteriota bacterium]